jgi:hypothetical protein
MSFGALSNRLFFKTVDTAEIVHLGGFSTANDMQIKYARMMIFVKGITAATEQFRINILPVVGSGTAIATSDWFDLADITTLTANWVGFFRFDFNGEFIDATSDYYAQFETQNYTRNSDTAYIGLALDWPLPINTPSVPTTPAPGIEFYGLE